MIKRLIEGMQVWAPESGMDKEGPGIGGHAGPKGRVRETESGATIGNINPGELSDSIDMSGQGGGGGEVIDRSKASFFEGGGESNATATPEHGGAIGGGPGGSQADAAGPSGGGSAR